MFSIRFDAGLCDWLVFLVFLGVKVIPCEILGWCIALGGTTALDTLGSQAFGSQLFEGASQSTDLSIHLQRCTLVLWLLAVPVCFAWAFIEPILLVLGQSPSLSRDVQNFLRVLIWGAPGYIGFESLKKYLQCQGCGSSKIGVLNHHTHTQAVFQASWEHLHSS